MSTALLDRRAPAGTLFRLATAGSVIAKAEAISPASSGPR